MSVHKNWMERVPVTTPQTADSKQTNRLYPTLPSLTRLEFCLPVSSATEKLPEAAESRLTEDKRLEISSHEAIGAEILVLEEQNKELLTINKKWAKEYRTMVQYYKEKVRLLKGLQLDSQSGEEKSDDEESNFALFTKHVKTDTQMNDDHVRCELDELREQNRTLTRRGRHQQEEIRRLNKALQEALLTTQRLSCTETPHEVWKHQAEVYKEDFTKERKDREKLQARYSDLEKRYKKTLNELFGFKSQTRVTKPADCCSCTKRGPKWDFHQPHI